MRRLEITVLEKEELGGYRFTAVMGSSRGFGKTVRSAIRDLFTCPNAEAVLKRLDKPMSSDAVGQTSENPTCPRA